MAHALAATGARILIVERGDFVPQEDENWDPEAVWKHLRYRTTERWLDERGARVPAVHALLRRRQHEVLGQRAVPASARGLRGGRSTPTACRPRGRSTTTRSSRTTTRRAAVSRARRSTASIRPRRRAARIPYAAGAARRRRWRRSSTQLRKLGPASVAAAARAAAAGRIRRLHAVQHVQLVSVQGPREERRRSVLRSPGDGAAERRRCGRTRCARRLITDPSGAKVEAVEVERNGETVRVDAPARRRVVRRGELRGAAAAVGERRASRRPREFVGARRPALHGAPRDDDAGVSSVPAERDGVSEDGGHQRLLPARAGHARIRSARSSRRGGRTA